MSVATGTYLTYTAIGIREDLTDQIYNISPTETPFVTGIKTTKADQSLHEWQTDSLATPDTTNAQLQGDDPATFATATPTVRINNRCQISTKTVSVSGTLDAVNKAGRKSEMSYQSSKRVQELKRDLEAILTGNQALVVGNSSTPATLRSLESWYATNVNKAVDGANGSASTARTDGTARVMTEAMLADVRQKTWSSGGQPDVLMCASTIKQLISTFGGSGIGSTANTRFVQMDKKGDITMASAFDFYRDDFGTVKVVPNVVFDLVGRVRTVHLLQMDMWAAAYLRTMRRIPLATTGDSTKAMWITEYTLEAKNEASSGIIADIKQK